MNEEKIYPLLFEPIFKDKIWGGQKIRETLGKDFGSLPNCGETWEISGVKGNVSVIANGSLKGKTLTEAIELLKERLVGKTSWDIYGHEFPLLVKFIDANDDLSLQVHPNDDLAKKRHQSLGKTEMWYVLQADQGSSLISGFSKTITQEIYLEKLQSGKIFDVLNKEMVQAGDCYFLPAGRVHTIGKGLLIAEIQQTSDVTYRIYDFDRVDDKGQKRELHTEEALAAIDYKAYPNYKTAYTKEKNAGNPLVACTYFGSRFWDIQGEYNVQYPTSDSFRIWVVVGGEGQLSYKDLKFDLKTGQSWLVPAEVKELVFSSIVGVQLVEAFLP